METQGKLTLLAFSLEVDKNAFLSHLLPFPDFRTKFDFEADSQAQKLPRVLPFFPPKAAAATVDIFLK